MDAHVLPHPVGFGLQKDKKHSKSPTIAYFSKNVQETSSMHWHKRHLRNRNLRGSDRGSLLSHVLPSASSSVFSDVRSVASTLWRSVFSCVSSRSSFRSRSSRKHRRSAQSFFDDFEKDTSSLSASRRSEGSEEELEPPMPSERGLREDTSAEPKADQQPEPPTGSPPMSEPGPYPGFPPPEYGKDHESAFESYQTRFAEAEEIWENRDQARDHKSPNSAGIPWQDAAGPSSRAPSSHESFDLFAKTEPEEKVVKEELPAYDDEVRPPKYGHKRDFQQHARERLAALGNRER